MSDTVYYKKGHSYFKVENSMYYIWRYITAIKSYGYWRVINTPFFNKNYAGKLKPIVPELYSCNKCKNTGDLRFNLPTSGIISIPMATCDCRFNPFSIANKLS